MLKVRSRTLWNSPTGVLWTKYLLSVEVVTSAGVGEWISMVLLFIRTPNWSRNTCQGTWFPWMLRTLKIWFRNESRKPSKELIQSCAKDDISQKENICGGSRRFTYNIFKKRKSTVVYRNFSRPYNPTLRDLIGSHNLSDRNGSEKNLNVNTDHEHEKKRMGFDQ